MYTCVYIDSSLYPIRKESRSGAQAVPPNYLADVVVFDLAVQSTKPFPHIFSLPVSFSR